MLLRVAIPLCAVLTLAITATAEERCHYEARPGAGNQISIVLVCCDETGKCKGSREGK